jgi:MFS family permease
MFCHKPIAHLFGSCFYFGPAGIEPDQQRFRTNSLGCLLALVYRLGLAVGLLLVGRIMDVFGRRYFFIGGASIGMIRSIVASRASTIPILIGGQTMIEVALQRVIHIYL